MYNYQHSRLNELITLLLRSSVSAETFTWLQETATANNSRFNSAFVAIPRKTGHSIIQTDDRVRVAINEARHDLHIEGWTIDRLARVWLLMQVRPEPQDQYFRLIENLFLAAEVNELVALYSALPVLAFPEQWKRRCAEGIRSNIADVLTAIMCNNPYPAENLDDAAWNQLVLKAFFTGKPIAQIIGIDLRANKQLAFTLSDYAHERWAAHRNVNPQLWRCVGPFLDEQLYPDIQRILSSGDPLEKEAGALASYWSNFPQAKQNIPAPLLKGIESGELTWDHLAGKMNNYVLQ